MNPASSLALLDSPHGQNSLNKLISSPFIHQNQYFRPLTFQEMALIEPSSHNRYQYIYNETLMLRLQLLVDQCWHFLGATAKLLRTCSLNTPEQTAATSQTRGYLRFDLLPCRLFQLCSGLRWVRRLREECWSAWNLSVNTTVRRKKMPLAPRYDYRFIYSLFNVLSCIN